MFLSHLLCSIIENDWKVLLVTNHQQYFGRANSVLSEKKLSESRRSPTWFADAKNHFSEETWTTVGDLSDVPWPFNDNEFDLVICGHTLEIARDPLALCKEMQRVSKRGYIETISPVMSFVRDLDRRDVAGYPHHRWFVDVKDNKLIFTFRNQLVQNLEEYHIYKPDWAKGINPLKNALGIFWEDSFQCCEDKDAAEFPDWYFEEVFGNDWAKNPKEFFHCNQPVPVLLNKSPFTKGMLVTNKELDIKFSVSMFDSSGRPSADMRKFEVFLKQQGKL